MTIPGEGDGVKPSAKASRPDIRLAAADTRPDILLTANVHKTTSAMVAALAADPDLYHRGGALVHVVRSTEMRGATPRTPIVRAIPHSVLLNRVSQYGCCKKKGKTGEWKHTSPPAQQVRSVLEQGQWATIRPLSGVIESPSLRPDGSILQAPGYDADTQHLLLPNASYATVPESPTQSDAAKAYAHLADIFVDFPYIDESHRSAAVSALLTILARTAIGGAVPCWLFDAASKRSGKSLQVNVISIIATGRPAPVMTYPEDDEELEKVLASFALAGARIVNFDNVARAFGGAALDKCITAIDTVQLRVLGTMETPIVPWRAVILASGNQVTARGDMLPRLLSPRIESPLEQPETRNDFRHPERAGEDKLCAWALENRSALVVEAITLLRAYVVAGRPPQDIPRWGGFSSWTSLIASALVWAGAPNPMGARRGGQADDDPRAAAETGLVAGWAELCRTHAAESLTASGAIAHLYPPPRKDEPPDGFDELRECIQTLTMARPGFPPATDRLSRALRSLKNRPLAGLKLTSDGATHGVTRWAARPAKG